METRSLGVLGPVSALALGGGGIGAVWGETTREEGVATLREALDLGITVLDAAPGYNVCEALIGEEEFYEDDEEGPADDDNSWHGSEEFDPHLH